LAEKAMNSVGLAQVAPESREPVLLFEEEEPFPGYFKPFFSPGSVFF
jgi:hypothetical protein